MKIMCWNCRGAGRPLTISHLRDMTRCYRPGVVFLMESKNTEESMERKRLSFGYTNSYYINPIGSSGGGGGGGAWWSYGTKIDVLSFSASFIHIFLHGDQGFHCTFVHAPNNPGERRMVWDDIGNLHNSDTARMIVGDFNSIMFGHEKEGGNLVSIAALAPFVILLTPITSLTSVSKAPPLPGLTAKRVQIES
ncbi:hypothetical protein LINGRAHAP2_LOCUS4931 [Linum grandiflorum]